MEEEGKMRAIAAHRRIRQTKVWQKARDLREYAAGTWDNEPCPDGLSLARDLADDQIIFGDLGPLFGEAA